jgi:sugar phosphate isomerase/epimerase
MGDGVRFFIGNQTAFSAPVSDPFAFALAHGFEAFEFFPDGHHGRGWSAEDVSAAERQAFRAAACERNVRLSVHAALTSTTADNASRAKLLRDIDLAGDLGARVLNVHLDLADAEAFARSALSLTDYLGPMGITLALENTVSTGPEEINRFFLRLRSLDRERARGIGLCLDIGHANLYGGTHNDFLGFVDRLDPSVPIVHAHVHENWGDADLHLTLFTGPASRDPSGVAGLLGRLRRRGYHGSLILEQWPMPPSLLVDARDRLRALQEDA